MSYLSMHKTRLGSVLCMAHMAPFQLANSPLTHSPTAERRKPFHILTGRTVPFGLAKKVSFYPHVQKLVLGAG